MKTAFVVRTTQLGPTTPLSILRLKALRASPSVIIKDFHQHIRVYTLLVKDRFVLPGSDEDTRICGCCTSKHYILCLGTKFSDPGY